MDLQKQEVTISDFRDRISLDVVQHEKTAKHSQLPGRYRDKPLQKVFKPVYPHIEQGRGTYNNGLMPEGTMMVKLIFEPHYHGETIRAELLSPGCQSGGPCSRLVPSVSHTDERSYLSIAVHPNDPDYRKVYLTVLLVLVGTLLLCTWWMLTKWMNRNRSKNKDTSNRCLVGYRRWSAGYNSDGSEVDADSEYADRSLLNEESTSKIHSMNNNCQCEQSTSQDGSPHPGCPCGMTVCGGKQGTRDSDGRQRQGTRDSDGHQRQGTRDSDGRGWRYVGGACGLLIVGAVMMMTVTSLTRGHTELSTLKLSIPDKANIRHIRSYSEDPSITDVHFQKKGDGESSLITRLQLFDLSPECRNNLTLCRTHALCDTSRWGGDGIKCRCNQGFYLKDLTCTACTTSCDDGFYMVKQCTAEADRQCKPCTQCEGSSYEVARCTSTQDTLCIDVTFPMRQFEARGTSVEELVSLNVSMSRNVFLEHLHKIKKLETPLYMPNNRQEMQFVWRRPSGLEIKVKVSDIYLIPEYVDIDHVDDWTFIDMGFPEDIKRQVNKVMGSNCRHPLPDEYDLSVRVSRDVATAATEVMCDKKSCPKGAENGDRYVYQELYKACSKITSSQPFKRQRNSILCSGNNDMLNQIFRMRVDDTVPLTFPTTSCQAAQQNCGRCLHEKSCTWGFNGTDCCNLECLKQSDCKNLYSDSCPTPKVECARGDISKFTIMPRYPSIERKFACHLRHLPPRHLYLLSYEASIPSLQFTLGERRKEITYKNLSDYQDGSDSADYLNMNHHTVKKYDDEVILVGVFDPDRKDRVKNYTLHKLKPPWAFDRAGGYRVNMASRSRYKTKIQFTRPFRYSTSSWRWDGCRKNVSEVVPSQLIYELHGLQVVEPDKKMKGDRFVYQLKSDGAVSLIKFSVPENTSILSYYKDSYSSARLVPSSLSGKISWQHKDSAWVVDLSGHISDCPGYFTVELYSDNSTSRLALYDMLVNCPQKFNIQYTIRRKSVQMADLFVVVVNDSISSYRVVLTSVQGPQFFSSDQNKLVTMDTAQQSPWIPIIAIVVITLLVVCALFLGYVYLDRKKSKHMSLDLNVPKPDLGPQITLLDHVDTLKADPITYHKRLIMGTLIILYLVYAILFSFTALFCVLYVVQGRSIGEMTIVSNTSVRIQQQMQAMLGAMVDTETTEVTRQLNGLRSRLNACSNHMKSSVSEAIPDLNEEMYKTLTEVFHDKGTVHQMLNKYFINEKENYQAEIDKFITEFNRTLDTNLNKVRTTYTAYLKELAGNEWFSFPKKLYLDQQMSQGSRLDKVTDDLAGFLKWLEIDKVQEIIEIKHILMDRMLTMMPTINVLELLEGTEGSSKITTSSLNFTMPENSFKFVSGPAPGYRGNKFPYGRRFGHFRSKNETLKQAERVKSISGIAFPVFIGVFAILDILLFLYRMTWLRNSFIKFKNGLEHKVPFDSIARTIHFILTGKDLPKGENLLDHPYDYYLSNNKENIWADNPEQYFLYCSGSQKTKEDILRNIFAYKQSQKPKIDPVEKPGFRIDVYIVSLLKPVYRLAISPVFWRFIIICGFVLFLCLVAKATDDLVTMESAVFLMDTEVMMPVLARQSAMSDAVIRQHANYLNEFLVNYKVVLDTEVQSLNTVLVEVSEKQLLLLNSLISDMCNLAGVEKCGSTVNLVSLSLSSCNFLPLHAQPYIGVNEDNLSEFINGELFPLVVNLRGILFTALYLLLIFAASMLICQTCARVIYVHLRKSRHLLTTNIYQMPCTSLDPQFDTQYPKDVYNSHSVIAESCESGVYDMAVDQS